MSCFGLCLTFGLGTGDHPPKKAIKSGKTPKNRDCLIWLEGLKSRLFSPSPLHNSHPDTFNPLSTTRQTCRGFVNSSTQSIGTANSGISCLGAKTIVVCNLGGFSADGFTPVILLRKAILWLLSTIESSVFGLLSPM